MELLFFFEQKHHILIGTTPSSTVPQQKEDCEYAHATEAWD